MDDTEKIRAGIARIAEQIGPGIEEVGAGATALRVVSVTARIAAEADAALRNSVDSARNAGATWEEIGRPLSISRQAAQQRFGRVVPPPEDLVHRLTPVTALDEMERLNEAGRHGWHSIAYGWLYHDLIRSDRQWEHRRVSALTSNDALEAEGWRRIGTLWFPWAYYARPLDAKAIPEG